jgi:hypothetical protein
MRNLEEKCVSLLEEIRREHELSEQLLQAGFQRCKKVGELILKLKGMLSPEEFEQWLQWNSELGKKEAESCIALCKGEKVKITLSLREEVKSEEC